MIAAWGFDRRISKETQLGIYLNRTYFGGSGSQSVIGYPAAAEAFFGKPLAHLSDLEFFGLLAMLEAPNWYHVKRQPKANAERVERIRQKVQRACRDGCFRGEAPIPCAALDVDVYISKKVQVQDQVRVQDQDCAP